MITVFLPPQSISLGSLLFNNCFFFLYRIYERIIETPSMDIPAGTTLWLGQRNNVHGFFKVRIALSSALYDLNSDIVSPVFLEEAS